MAEIMNDPADGEEYEGEDLISEVEPPPSLPTDASPPPEDRQ